MKNFKKICNCKTVHENNTKLNTTVTVLPLRKGRTSHHYWKKEGAVDKVLETDDDEVKVAMEGVLRLKHLEDNSGRQNWWADGRPMVLSRVAGSGDQGTVAVTTDVGNTEGKEEPASAVGVEGRSAARKSMAEEETWWSRKSEGRRWT